MAITQLIFKKGNFIGTIELDVIIIESANATVRVTENPVESAANVNDHIIIEPFSFTVEGVVSDINSTFLNAVTSTPDAFTTSTRKSAEAWEALLELQASRTPFTLVQNLKTYQNVIILSLAESQDKDTSNGLFFFATMREIILVGSQIVNADSFDDPNIADKMVPTTQGGLKQLET